MARDRRRKQPGKPRVPVHQALFLTIGVPEGEAGKRQIKRAAELLQHEGFRVGITSPEAILAAAELIRQDQEKLAGQAERDVEPAPPAFEDNPRYTEQPGDRRLTDPQSQGETEHGGDPEPA